MLATSTEWVDALVNVEGMDRTAAEALPVYMAFTVAAAAPASWQVAQWTTSAASLTASILVGPNGLSLAAGTYNVWVRIDDTGSADLQFHAGVLQVSAGPWSYSGDPASSALDATRFWLRDTTEPALWSDAELNYLLGLMPSPLDAASLAATQKASEYAADPTSESIGDVSVNRGQRHQAMITLARELRMLAAQVSGGQPVIFGLADPAGYNHLPTFSKGMHDTPGAEGWDIVVPS